MGPANRCLLASFGKAGRSIITIIRTTIVTAALAAMLPILLELDVQDVSAEPADGYGTAHPTVLHVVDPAGQWMVVCQARVDTDGDGKVGAFLDGEHGEILGDDVEPYLMLRPGEGRRIDNYVAHDRSGRWLVVIRERRLLLIETRTGVERDLSAKGASTEDVDPVFGPHAAASFDARGRRVLYVRKSAERVVVVVRDLRTHEEVGIDPGPGLFHRAWLEPSGLWVHVRVVVEDTDGDGKLELPTVATTLSDRRCRGDVHVYSTYGRSGDDDVLRVAPTSGGEAGAVEGLVAPVGEALLRRRADGVLALRAKDGTEQVVSPAAERALLFARAATTGAFVLAHAGDEKGRPLWLHQGSKRVRLPTARRPEGDEDTILHGRWWVHTHVTPEAGIADLQEGVLVRVPGRSAAVDGDRVLLRRASGLVVRDLVSGKELPVPGNIAGTWRLLQTGPALAEDGRMIHLGDPSRSGAYEGTALAVARDGRVLIGSGRGRGMLHGPLRWVRPSREEHGPR